MQLTRKRFFGTILAAALVGAALAGPGEVIHFAPPSTVTAGQNFSAGVTVNQAPMSVTFSSNPPGLVNYTITLNSASQTVSVPTNGAMPAGSYTLVAGPTAGGTGKSKIAVAVSSGL